MFIQAEKGDSFYNAVAKVQSKIIETGSAYADLEFNEIQITVHEDSRKDDLAIIYDLKNKLRQNGIRY